MTYSINKLIRFCSFLFEMEVKLGLKFVVKIYIYIKILLLGYYECLCKTSIKRFKSVALGI